MEITKPSRREERIIFFLAGKSEISCNEGSLSYLGAFGEEVDSDGGMQGGGEVGGTFTPEGQGK